LLKIDKSRKTLVFKGFYAMIPIDRDTPVLTEKGGT
jgi:hypothetical protein